MNSNQVPLYGKGTVEHAKNDNIIACHFVGNTVVTEQQDPDILSVTLIICTRTLGIGVVSGPDRRFQL